VTVEKEKRKGREMQKRGALPMRRRGSFPDEAVKSQTAGTTNFAFIVIHSVLSNNSTARRLI
jgi:hypothetical protein